MSMDENLTVLVVDDSDIIRYSLKNFFQDYNLEVVTCLDGLEGIQKASEYKPCLIFLDLMMPNFDGVKMLQVIRVMDTLKETPVIVISGNTNKRNVLAAIEAGADRVISKPLHKDIILKHINELLGPNFLARRKKSAVFSDNDNKEIVNHLRKFFLNTFPAKKTEIISSLENKDKDLLKSIVHEMKGTGGAIGYPDLSAIAGEIENKLESNKIDWSYIKIKCEQIFSIVGQIENTYSKAE